MQFNGLQVVATSILVLQAIASSDSAIVSTETGLIQALLSNYDSNARPAVSQQRTTNVSFGLELVHLVNVDDRNQMITTNVWVRQSWKNELLVWDPAKYNNIKTVRIDAKLLWIPDIVLYNSADTVFSGGLEKYKTRVIVGHNGACAWYSPASFRSTCKIDVTYFPFDQQRCSMKFGSWTFVVNDLDMLADATNTVSSNYVKSAEWDLVNATKKRNEQKYACCPYPFSDVTVEIVIRRKPLFFAFNLITPCMIMLAMILLGFFLPPESGERITLSITVLLAMAVFLQLVAETLPRNSESIPLLGRFYITIMAEIAISLMATCWVLNIHHRNSGTSIVKMPQWVEIVVLSWLSTALCVRKPPEDRGRGCDSIVSLNKATQQVAKTDHENCVEVRINDPAKDLKPTARIIKEHCPVTATNGRVNCTLASLAPLSLYSPPASPRQKHRSQHNRLSENIITSQCLRKKLAREDCLNYLEPRVFQDVSVVAEHTRLHKEIEENQEKWKHVAMVLDRLFFWAFILTIIISTFVVFKERLSQPYKTSG